MSCLNVVQDYTLEFPITNTRVIYGKICYVTKPEQVKMSNLHFCPFLRGSISIFEALVTSISP